MNEWQITTLFAKPALLKYYFDFCKPILLLASFKPKKKIYAAILRPNVKNHGICGFDNYIVLYRNFLYFDETNCTNSLDI